MKNYFIGQGTGIVATFDTKEEMLAFHKAMPAIDRHFCKLYDTKNKKMADGWAIQYGDRPECWR